MYRPRTYPTISRRVANIAPQVGSNMSFIIFVLLSLCCIICLCCIFSSLLFVFKDKLMSEETTVEEFSNLSCVEEPINSCINVSDEEMGIVDPFYKYDSSYDPRHYPYYLSSYKFE